MDEIVAFLQTVPTLAEVPREQLEWLVRESEVRTYESGLIARPGDANDLMDYMIVVLEGSLEGYAMQNGQRKTQMVNPVGGITGMLPFSRMKYTPVYIEAHDNPRVLALHTSKFHELIAHNYELTAVIVHSMIDRVRVFTGNHFQNEKLMSLGKLSAGITHELNNPAAAIVRSADDLKKSIGSIVESLPSITSLALEPKVVEELIPILSKDTSVTRLSLLERKRLEGEICDWLEDRKLPSDNADTLLAFGLKTADLDRLQKIVPEESFTPFLNWLSLHLRVERSVEEIGISARRISDLVQSVKSYTRMDQIQDMQELCINDGIGNTLTMLEHKFRKNSVTLHQELAAGLPLIMGFPGELNQVWTNIIDNALDAMKSGGELTIRTFENGGQVVFDAVDNGPGIPAENLERIFDPFFTTKDVGEGTGVGLDVVQKVVTSHKGKIDVNSKPGRTEFLISFPKVGVKL